jgi:hypothetical protein
MKGHGMVRMNGSQNVRPICTSTMDDMKWLGRLPCQYAGGNGWECGIGNAAEHTIGCRKREGRVGVAAYHIDGDASMDQGRGQNGAQVSLANDDDAHYRGSNV